MDYFEFKVGDKVKHSNMDSRFYGKSGTVTEVRGETVDVRHSKRQTVWTLSRHLELVAREEK